MQLFTAPVITLVVHPIDTAAHPTLSPGWRWAVHVGQLDAADPGQCANAGWALNRGTAFLDGETCAATAVRAARLLGTLVRYTQIELDCDPIPPGADRVHTL